jgi:ribonucleoside-diphosphate reductase alpha chain
MLIEKSPYYKAMANDVDWVEKVRMQGKIQQWVDHSISVTVNLPEHVTEELVNNVYITAWEEGCKGCTIYRDGSRSGVLISKEDKQKEELFKDSHAPKRPDELECSLTTFMNKGERWIGLIGLLDGKPYEIFTGKHENFPIPTYVETAKIVRRKTNGASNYDVVYLDKLGSEIRIPNLNHAFDKEFYDMAKTFSAILRHGMPLPYVIQLIDGLNLDGDIITTWKAGVKRMLKKFIKEGTSMSGKKCKECDSESLQYTEGCLSCKNCGLSKCG